MPLYRSLICAVVPPSRNVRWLLDELPGLVGSGSLSAEAADALRRHYAADQSRGTPLGLLISGLLGSLLLASGLILILAHNWDEFSRPVRLVLSFLPITAGIGLSAWVLLRRLDSMVWRESAGLFHALAVASSIALIGQTYHLPGDLYDFLLTWMLLSVPLVYLLSACSVCILYLAGATFWAGGTLGSRVPGYLGLPILAPAVPFYLMVLREGLRGYRASWLSFLFALAVPFVVGMGLSDTWEWTAMFSAGGLATAMYLTGAAVFPPGSGMRPHPFRFLGGFGVAALAIAFTYPNGWRHWAEATSHWFALDWIYALGWSLLALALAAWAMVRRRDVNPAAAALPVMIGLGWALAWLTHDTSASALLFSAYALGLGLVTLVRGVRRSRLSSANAGLVILCALVLVRFFDSNYSFVARGLAFMLCGAGFLVANVAMFRRRKMTA